jgi:hypothetical protein
MAAGKFGSSSIVITLDDAPGGTARTITPYVTSIGGIKVSQITEKTNPFGTSHEENTPVGMQHVDDITIEGYYDTTATSGPHVVMGTPDDGPQDATRTFTFAPGDSKTFTMEVRLVDYSVIATNGNLTKYQATIRQAGAGTWA